LLELRFRAVDLDGLLEGRDVVSGPGDDEAPAREQIERIDHAGRSQIDGREWSLPFVVARMHGPTQRVE
jgi:hypothetical protein